MRQFSTQPHPTYLSTLKVCRVELCTELFHAIIPTLFLVTFLMFFILVYTQMEQFPLTSLRHLIVQCSHLLFVCL